MLVVRRLIRGQNIVLTASAAPGSPTPFRWPRRAAVTSVPAASRHTAGPSRGPSVPAGSSRAAYDLYLPGPPCPPCPPGHLGPPASPGPPSPPGIPYPPGPPCPPSHPSPLSNPPCPLLPPCVPRTPSPPCPPAPPCPLWRPIPRPPRPLECLGSPSSPSDGNTPSG